MASKKTVPLIKIRIQRNQSNSDDPLHSPRTPPSKMRKNNSSDNQTKIFSSPNRYSILNDPSSFDFNNSENADITDIISDNTVTNNGSIDHTPMFSQRGLKIEKRGTKQNSMDIILIVLVCFWYLVWDRNLRIWRFDSPIADDGRKKDCTRADTASRKEN
ncbi:hypothetical protein QTP88_025972 [Uroleucon formosanum]